MAVLPTPKSLLFLHWTRSRSVWGWSSGTGTTALTPNWLIDDQLPNVTVLGRPPDCINAILSFCQFLCYAMLKIILYKHKSCNILSENRWYSADIICSRDLGWYGADIICSRDLRWYGADIICSGDHLLVCYRLWPQQGVLPRGAAQDTLR